jgi:hypothetical protein
MSRYQHDDEGTELVVRCSDCGAPMYVWVACVVVDENGPHWECGACMAAIRWYESQEGTD